ncbi:hypothetical protein CNMCM5793_008416 [Aspergillus hiratsukae]|uniref:Zn(2)-C6 fungal-type domain-containing protein n=1 Tax=Aspergillus hiratsukae TaxID=1194566 RepID=A0A8H6UEM1_9EURO|nr:hypothetical protein CNMCM5793_008416 [Aspergillus hiratsukae]KAF7158220.1 hypothetical protein CNMCM6106_004586 [Aspergillus hiratsukae]
MKVKQKSVCGNCRKRKLGCDGKHPECSQCTLTGRKCPGYPQEWTFVQQNIPATEASHQIQIPANGATGGSRQESVKIKGSPSLHISRDANAQHGVTTVKIPDVTSASPDELAFIVLEHYIPRDELPFLSYDSNVNRCSRICGSWVEVLPRLANTSSQDSVFFVSMKALAFAIAAYKDPQRVSTLDATRVYSAAICALRRQLAAKSQPFDAELAASIMCLSLAEGMFPGSVEGMSAHIKGVGQLMKAHGPNHYQAGLLHKLFVGFRPLLVIEAFRCRQPTFLAEKQWTSIPFAFSNTSLMQDFLSGVANIPNYLHAVDQLMVNPDDASPEYITEVCFGLVEWISRLEEWEQTLEREEGGPYDISSGKEHAAEAINPGITGHTLWYPSVTAANVSTHLWAIRIVCLKEIDKLNATFGRTVEACLPTEFCNVEYRQNQVLTLSKRICHSMEYLLQDDLQFFGPASTVFPLKVVYDCFREMALENEAVAGATIELLEARLQRLTYLLTGDASWTGTPTAPAKPASLDDTVSRRLLRLEKDLENLSRHIPAVRDVLQLHDRFPDLFRPTPPQSIPENLTTQNLASIVLSYASAFPETASRLTSLNDLPVPDARASASLVQLQPRLDQLARTQDEQARQISELRVRTARVLQRWYEVGLVGSGECWAEWEGRLEDVEREVKREEVVRERRAREI